MQKTIGIVGNRTGWGLLEVLEKIKQTGRRKMISEDYYNCPRCRYKKATIRYGSMGWLQFVGCPKCGFIEINSPYPEHNTKSTKKDILKILRGDYLKISKLTDFMGDKK